MAPWQPKSSARRNRRGQSRKTTLKSCPGWAGLCLEACNIPCQNTGICMQFRPLIGMSRSELCFKASDVPCTRYSHGAKAAMPKQGQSVLIAPCAGHDQGTGAMGRGCCPPLPSRADGAPHHHALSWQGIRLRRLPYLHISGFHIWHVLNLW